MNTEKQIEPMIHARVSPDNLDKIKKIAKLSGRTISNTVNRLIQLAKMEAL